MAIITQRNAAAEPRIATYTRISEDRDGTSSATDRQLADTNAAAERSGRIVQRFSDPEASAYRKGAKRPGFAAMLAAFDQGTIDTIVVWRADRLARAFREWAKVLVRVDDHGLRVIDCFGVDTATGGGRQMLGILAEQARSESATMGARQARAARERAEKGLPGGRKQRPFGHTDDQSQLVEPEAALIREAAEAVLSGATFSSVQRAWLEHGVQMSPEGIRKLLASPRMVGAREVDGRLIATGAIAPILEADTYQLLRAALSVRRPPGRPRVDRLLSGLVRCGNCGELLSSGSQRGVPRYACHQRYAGSPSAGCGRVTVRGDHVEELVSEAVMIRLEGTKARREGGGDDRALARLEEITEQKGELARLWAARELDPVEWRAARAALLEEERHLSARLARDLVSGDVRVEWAQRPVAWRAALVRALVAEVLVDVARSNGPRFRPERVRIVWQQEEAVDAGEEPRRGDA